MGGVDTISLGGHGAERKPTANLTSTIPRFTVSGLEPGSKYIGELVGHNVKGAGDAKYIHVYTLKLPEKLIPPIEETSNISGKLLYKQVYTLKLLEKLISRQFYFTYS